ncbi:type VII toxin-antitoxin system MntA family adenylyltransferase antitoxin [Trichloromonas sp.]|uniref:type VII toxin-antitoxin system MntA family adenylyltransferase antitoxin n=1 Tax=Trichloromonas sp. TaxID=3069249 RepID=UPI003D81ABC3
MANKTAVPKLKCQLSPEQLGYLRMELSKLEHLELAYLHGSAASGRMRPDSDIDLALLFSRGKIPSGLLLLQYAAQLESVLASPVHFGLLDLSNPVFAKEVLSSGLVLYEKDSSFSNEFAMYVFSFYASLNEQRRPVLMAYGVNQ